MEKKKQVIKPALPKGTRDFGPNELRKRNYIFGVIKSVFEKYGFQPIETPVMENLSTLEGKYGEEGDKLLFRILNSGDFLKEVRDQKTEINKENLRQITSMISEKGLRYDLTIPFARYVVQHQHEITFPFKRYQIQPVWRADRPQRGRYREFYQCDADVIGSDSLLNEVELILIYGEVFSKLGIGVEIKINSRKIWLGLTELFAKEVGKNLGVELTEDQLAHGNVGDSIRSMAISMSSLVSIIDKYKKIGLDGVKEQLKEKGLSEDDISKLDPILKVHGENYRLLSNIRGSLGTSKTAMTGVGELEYILSHVFRLQSNYPLQIDFKLARGLDYYTGTILEVEAKNIEIGSIGGGGRYDNLTGVFGLPNVSGVGISFGVERIYDVMEELNLFANIDLQSNTTRALFINFGGEAETISFQYLQQLRANDIPAEMYPSSEKMKKQVGYADKKGIPYAIFVGEEELKSGLLQVKDLKTGEQKSYKIDEVIELLK